MPSTTRTLNQTIQWASFLTGNRPLNINNTADPALTSANMIIAAMLAPPFTWNWNRSAVSFLGIDPTGWVANKAVTTGYRIKDSFGHMQTVTTSGTTGAIVPAWNFTIGGTTADGTAVWTTSLISDYVVAASDFGCIEQAVAQTISSGLIYDIPNIVNEMTSDAGVGRSNSICPYLDDNAGNITFRIMPGMPDTWYQFTVTYQKRAAMMTGLASLWPIPDMYQHAYQTGFLGMAWLFSDDQRSAFMLQRFAAQVIALSEGLTEAEKNSFMEQWDILSASTRAAARANQGIGSRSLT